MPNLFSFSGFASGSSHPSGMRADGSAPNPHRVMDDGKVRKVSSRLFHESGSRLRRSSRTSLHHHPSSSQVNGDTRVEEF